MGRDRFPIASVSRLKCCCQIYLDTGNVFREQNYRLCAFFGRVTYIFSLEQGGMGKSFGTFPGIRDVTGIPVISSRDKLGI